MTEENKDIVPGSTTMTDEKTVLSFQRTALSYERTLMAWIRTATSMITFGFTIYKFFEELSQKPDAAVRIVSPRAVGMVMIIYGLVFLLVAQVQHRSAMRKLRKQYPAASRSLSSLLAILILLFGLTLFLAALFRQ